MRIVHLILTAAVLTVFGCSGNTQPSDEPVPFVSVPELKDVMCCMVEMFAETLWNTGVVEEPKTDDDWLPIEHATIGLVETGRFIQKSHLAKNNEDWVQFSQAMIDAAMQARETVKQKDMEKVVAAGEKLLTTCESCHKKYFNPPPEQAAQ